MKDTILTLPGIYRMDAKAFVGAAAQIAGESVANGWTLRILSSGGSVIASTENTAYKEMISPTDTVYFHTLSFIYHQ